jgi:hypothetical protein
MAGHAAEEACVLKPGVPVSQILSDAEHKMFVCGRYRSKYTDVELPNHTA